jgi:uncharacterized membrane protein YbhN (UPF0104 family)
MEQIKNKGFYKVISLLIKSIILILSFYYIWQKIKDAEKGIDFSEFSSSSNLTILFTVFILMFVNWSLEAVKWKILIKPLEEISFSKALKSVFAGVTTSIFTPNRIGEFAGRIFFLERADKIKAVLKSFVGSVMQLSITVYAGLIAIFVYIEIGFNTNVKFLNLGVLQIIGILIVVNLIVPFVMYRCRNRFSIKVQGYLQAFFEIKKKDFFIALGLSLVRYLVFSFQYYLILRVFHINIGYNVAMMLIAITFFVSSVIPTFALAEIAVRGAVAVYFFGFVGADDKAVVAASFTIWLINLALPALIGSAFVWKLKFFKE